MLKALKFRTATLREMIYSSNWMRCGLTLCFVNGLPYATDAKRDDYTPAPLRTECTERDFQECLKSFDTIVEHPSLGFAATEAELNQACRYLRTGVECIDGFVKRCTRNKAQQETLTVSVKGAFDILELLCEDSYHRNQYLQHAECYRRIAPEIESCMHPMRKMGLRQNHREKHTKTELDQMVCCAYHNATECIHQVSVSACSDRAASFLKNYTDRAAYPITQQCRQFDTKNCTTSAKSDSSSLLPSPWLFLPFTAMQLVR